MLNWLRGNQRIARSGTTVKPKQARTALMMQLEPRIMFDASVAAVAVDAVIQPDADESAMNAELGSQDLHSAGETASLQAGPSATQSREIVVIDTSVEGWQSLRDGVPDHAEVILVQPGTNGLQQVADALRGQTGIDAIHVLSHGDVGSIQLGDTVLNAANAQTYSAELASIGQSLSASGDVFLYGCYAAQGAEGRSFLGTLATLTGADIAASSDMTASTVRGGNWQLEETTGAVFSSIQASSAWAAYSGVLTSIPANVTIDFNASGFVEGTDHGSAVFTQGDFTITYSAANWFQDVDDGQGSSAGLFAGAFSGPETITIQTTSGNEFDLNSFYINVFGGGFASVQGFRDAGSTGTQTTGSGFGQTSGAYTVALDSSFDNVDRVVITSNSSGFFDVVDSFVLNTTNDPPAIANLNGDSAAWAGVGASVTLDASANASLTDTEFGALNGGNGDWSGGSLAVQRSGTAISADTLGFNLSGALFTVSGSNLQSGGQTFATFTNSSGVLTVNFTSSGTAATTALVDDVARHITYRNDTPSGDATVRFTLSDGVASTTANVTVTSDNIFVTNTTDTAVIDITNGVSVSEAVAIAAADATGSQTIAFAGSLASTALTINSVSLGESLTFDMDAASGMSLTTGTITLSSGTLSLSNGTGDTATISSVLASSGALTKIGAGTVTLSGTNTYSGATTISAGTLTVSGGDAISGNSSVAVASGATLALSNSESVGNLSGAGSITLGANTLTTTQTADTTFSGGISGTGGLSVNQTGAATFALTLTGTNTYSGTTTLTNYGRLRLDGDASVSSSSQLRVNGNSIVTLLSDQTVGSLFSNNASASIQLGSFTLSAGGDNTSTTVSGVISGSGNLVKQGSGTLTVAGTNTYTGTSTVSAGTLSVASDSNLGSDSVTLAAGATLDVTGATTIDNAIALSGNATVSNSANATLSGIISGANTLTKAGASTLTLSGSNTYAGTTVSAGTLSVASDGNLGSGTVTLASGATLAVTGAANIDNAIALTGNATVNTTANATLSGIISGANTLTKTGASALILSNSNSYAGTTVSAGTLSVASDANLGSGGISLAAGAILQVTGATNIDNTIALTGNATVNSSANATLSGVISGGFNLAKSGASALTLSGTNTYGGNTTVTTGTLSVASDSNLGSGGLTLAAGTTLAVTGATNIDNAITLSGAATINTTADATLSGNIGGAGSLAKTGANTLTLSGTNSYAGSTTVSAGVLSVASDGNLGSSTVTLATGTTLVITGSTTIDNAMAFSGNATVQAANAVTLSGVISGAGGLTKTGAGTVTLSGSNGFTGNVALSAGGLTLSGGAAIDNSSAVTMSGGTTLTLSSSETIGSLAGSGSVALGANTLTTGGDNTSTSFAGSIGGTGGGLTKAGAGTLTLSGTNTNTGNTTISGGALDAQNGDAIGDSSAVSVASGAFLVLSAAESIGSLAGAGSVSLGANTLTTGGNNSSTTFSGDLNGNGSLVKSGSGTLTLSNAGNSGSMSGDITVAGGTLSVASDNNLSSGTITLAGGSTLDVTGATNIDNTITLTGSATVSNSADATLSGIISGANNLTKTGASTLTLSGANLYSGTTVSAGTLSVASDGNLGSGGVALANGTTLALTGATTIDNALTLSGNVTVNNSAAVTLSGAISGNGNLAKSGASALTLSGTNAAHSGTTTVNAGTLSIGGDSNLGSGSVTLAGGTTLAVTAGGTIDNNLVLAGAATMQVGAATTWSGVISGSNNLAKTGSSTLTLSNTNTLSGIITVSAGTLSVTGTASAVTIESAATLTGTGTVDGAVTVQSGGTLSPGASPGTLTINGDLAMASGSTLVVELNGITAGTDYDQVIVNGTVDVSGATLSVTHGYVAGSGDVYNIIVNDAADAVTGTFSGISEGATVTPGGNGTVLTASYIGATGNDITLTAPVNPVVTSVSSSTPDGTYKIGDTISVSVTFDMAVFVNTTGGTPSLLLETGTVDRALNYASGSSTTTLVFGYTVQAGDLSADLDYASTGALVLNGSTIQDALTNSANLTLASPGAANSLGANKDLVVDGVVPTADIVITDTALTVGETSLVTITFSEAVTGLASSDLTIANGTLSAVTTGDGGITWTATLTPTASVTDATNLITLDNTGVQDAAGNTGTGTTDSNNYAIDTARPTAGIVVADTALAVGESSLVTITFSEAVAGLTNAGLTIANGTLSTVTTGDGGITWTATLTPTASITDATNLITLDNTGVQDAAGNAGTGTTDSNNYAIDTTRPTASVVVADTALVAGETSLVTITFGEAVTGFANADLTIANGTLTAVGSGDGGITWTATLTPTTDITDTTNLITLDNTGVQDAAGNAGTGNTDSNNYAIDTARPTATVVVADNSLIIGETSLVTITFSEAVTGFANADLTIANGTLTAVGSSDGGITWTATFTPSASITDTTNLITLTNAGVLDAAGNAGTGSTDSNNYAIDTARPTATIVVADSSLIVGESSLVTIAFNEAVTGFANADLAIANGTLSPVSSSDGGLTWTATLTPTASTTDATNLITLDDTGVQDAAGNNGTGSTDSNNYSIDTTRPTATIVVADTALIAGETSLVTITFSEAVTGLASSDLTIANGTLSTVTTGDGGITWTATLTPTASVTDATNLITLDNTSVQDAAGNNGGGSTDSNNYAIDTARPTASVVVADTALAVGESSLVTITFSEAVAGLTNADLTIANGTLSTATTGDGGITWTATLTPTASVTDATNLITLDNTGVQDAASNAGTGSTDSNNYAIDTLRPTATIVVADTALAAGESSLVTIAFSEAVAGLTTADITIANGTLSTVTTGDGGITWTATLTPTASITDATNLITLDNTGVQDAAGNNGAGSTDSNNYAIDTVRPTATIVVADTALAAGETSLVTITFSEAVAGLTNAGLTIANGTLSTATTGDGGITWTATLTPTASVADATNLITLDNTSVQDAAGNAGTGTTDSNNYAIDTARPTATIVVADTALAAGETSLVTITFSEAVTGFSNADLTVANGTLSAVSSSDGGFTWTATLTPTTDLVDATNLITLANTGVLDAAGNAGAGSTDSNNYAIDTMQVDNAPTVVSVSVPASGTYVAGQYLDFTVNLSEDVFVDSTGGSPRIAVTLDNGGTGYATYLSGSGSNALLFRLAVANGQLDVNGVTLGGQIDTNGATVRDAAGNDASVNLSNVGSTTGVLIDAVAPTASGLVRIDTSPANPGALQYLLSFSEDVSGVDLNDLRLVTTGSVSAGITSVTQVDARTYLISLNNVAGNGTLQVDLNSSGTGIVDTAGNALAGGLVGAPYPLTAPLTAVAPTILVARSDSLPVARPFSTIVDAPLSSSLPSIFDLQVEEFSSSGVAAASVYNMDLAANERINLPLPWRPANFTNWTVVELRSSDGSEVPVWLHYDYTTGTLQGTPPRGFHGVLEIEFVATDSHGQRVIGTMQLHFKDAAQRSDAADFLAPHARQAAAKPGLEAQFARHARNAPLDADAAGLLRQLHFRNADRQPIPHRAHF